MSLLESSFIGELPTRKILVFRDQIGTRQGLSIAAVIFSREALSIDQNCPVLFKYACDAYYKYCA